MTDATTNAPRQHPSGSPAQAFRARHEALLAVVTELTSELNAASAHGAVDRARLQHTFIAARSTLAQHVADAEADGGLLKQIVIVAPTFGPSVALQLQEHRELTAQLDDLIAAVNCGSDATELLTAARKLTARIDAHRQRANQVLADVMR